MEVWKTVSSMQEKIYDLSCTCTEIKQDNKDLRQEIACLHEMLEKIKELCEIFENFTRNLLRRT